MLVVKVEVWPGGDAKRAREISRIGISNTSELSPVSNYDVTALMNRDGVEEVLQTEVCNHEREAGWSALVRRVLTNILLARELCMVRAYDDPTAVHIRRGEHD